MQELWKSVPFKPFNEKYQVSNLGKVKPIKKSKFSNMKGEFLRYGVGARGYAFVTFYHEGIHKQCSVHRLVAYAFIGDPPKSKNIVCHLDDNKLNNVADNLIWGSPQDNMRHKVERGRSLVGSKNPRALLNDVNVRTIRRLYQEKCHSQAELALLFGVNQTQISRIVRGEHWGHIT